MSPTAKRPAARRGNHSSSSGSISLAAAEKILGVSLNVARERHARLTERERQAATMMASGKPNRRIAEELGISPKTLDIHRANLMRKLEARTAAQVANLVNLLQLADAAR
jgi:DNA-binding CsgD family transcriptional regulator